MTFQGVGSSLGGFGALGRKDRLEPFVEQKIEQCGVGPKITHRFSTKPFKALISLRTSSSPGGNGVVIPIPDSRNVEGIAYVCEAM